MPLTSHAPCSAEQPQLAGHLALIKPNHPFCDSCRGLHSGNFGGKQVSDKMGGRLVGDPLPWSNAGCLAGDRNRQALCRLLLHFSDHLQWSYDDLLKQGHEVRGWKAPMTTCSVLTGTCVSCLQRKAGCSASYVLLEPCQPGLLSSFLLGVRGATLSALVAAVVNLCSSCDICSCPSMLQRERFLLQYWPVNGKNASLIMLLSSINAVLYNLAHQAMIKNVSAVTTTVLGEIKIIVLLILSAMLLGTSLHCINTFAALCLAH